jgi:hypothetical protein
MICAPSRSLGRENYDDATFVGGAMKFTERLTVRTGLIAVMLIVAMLVACSVTLWAIVTTDDWRQSASLPPEIYKEYWDLMEKYHGYSDQQIPEADSARIDRIQASYRLQNNYGEIAVLLGGTLFLYGSVTAAIAMTMMRRLVRPLEIISR